MNAEQANAIPMTEIMEAINYLPVKNSNSLDIWYYSPFREEKTPSLHVNAVKNIWYDFGEGRGGTVLDFVCAYLAYTKEDYTVVDALRWLDNMMLKPSPLISFPKKNVDENNASLVLQAVYSLKEPALICYLSSRGIPYTLARKYVREALVYNSNTGNQFFAICLRNEDNGHELRNKFFKGSVGPKNISFIRGAKTSQGDIHVFEGWSDFITALVYQRNNRFEGDAIVLNSVNCLSRAFPYIETCPYKTLYAWLDNDSAGAKATEALREFAVKRGLDFKAMNSTYAPHKDINEWHMKKLEL